MRDEEIPITRLNRILGSCTAHLEEITSQDETLKNIGKKLRFPVRMWLIQCPADPIWKQYRFSVGAPDAEAKFKASVQDAQQVDMNCVNFPSIFVCLSRIDLSTLIVTPI
jgi:ubiquitin-conjugating enzyme E2 Q